MEGVEIVITPRTLERLLYLTLIAVLLVLVVVKWGGDCSELQNETSANVVAIEQAQAEEIEPAEVEAAATGDGVCDNGVKDGTETDVDCGGTCSPCVEYKACNLDADCNTGLYCFQHIKCLRATCDDGLKNQDETDSDCGGTCGGYWWKSDKSCHDKVEPSGEFDAVITATIGRSENSGNAVIQNMKIAVDNGFERDLSLDIFFYARTANGGVIFENFDGEIPISNIKVSVESGAKVSKTVDMAGNTRATLPGIKSSDAFQIVALVKDSAKRTVIDEFSWVNE